MQKLKGKRQNNGRSLAHFLNFKSSILSSRKGFTLLELMISTAIIAVIVVIIAGALRLGLKSVSSGEKRAETLERFRASLSIIDSQIQSEMPLTYKDEDGAMRYYFKGDRTSLDFSTNFSLWGGQTGYVIASYNVETDNSGKTSLSVSENIIGIEAKRTATLLEAYDDIYFEYFYKDPAEENGKWIEQWTEDAIMPEKIRLRLVKDGKELSILIPMRTKGSLVQTISAGGGIGPKK